MISKVDRLIRNNQNAQIYFTDKNDCRIQTIHRFEKVYYYALTIDKATTDTLLKKSGYIKLCKDIMLRCGLHAISPYHIFAFEEKHKSERFPKWLHYHTLLWSYQSYVPYKQTKRKNYSIKLEKLKTSYDVANWAGYLCKQKIDKTNVIIPPNL